jgi:hypothetical protein
MAGRGTARLKVAAGDGTDTTWTLRLGDVQRHVVVKTPNDHMRLLEGLEGGDWLRVKRNDGTTAEGRLSELAGLNVRLNVTQPDGTVTANQVDLKTVVQIDGLAKSAATTRMLQDLMVRDPVAVTLWPDGREIIGRVADNVSTVVKIDVDGDGNGDESIAVDAPVAAIHRVAAIWRDQVRDLTPTTAVKLRAFEDYPDARVEREWTGFVAATTAYAISIKSDDGCAVVPFENVQKIERVSGMHAEKPRPIEVHHLKLPVLPGDPREVAARADAKKGVTALTDGQTVSHVYVSSAWEESIAGIRLGSKLEDVMSNSELRFTTEVLPKGEKDNELRELISESVDGLRVTMYVGKHSRVQLVELTRR